MLGIGAVAIVNAAGVYAQIVDADVGGEHAVRGMYWDWGVERGAGCTDANRGKSPQCAWSQQHVNKCSCSLA
jgi:hypothetical protein